MGFEQQVTATLVSKADTTGFREFKAANDQFVGARREATTANGLFVESERRVRTNLMGTLEGIFQAKDASAALASSVEHLSEVFQVGALGAIAGGVAGVIIEQFSKAEQAIDKVGQSLEEQSTKAGELLDRLEKVKDSQQSRDRQDIGKMAGSLTSARESESGVFNMGNLMRGLNLVSGGALFDDAVRKMDENQKKQETLARQVQQATLLAGNPKTYEDRAKLEADAADKRRVNEDMARDELKQERDFQEQGKAYAETQKKAADEAARLKKEQDTKAAYDAEEKKKAADRAAAAEAKQESKEDRQMVKEGRVHLDVIAGSQRQMGGGGGAFSVITQDPAVVEQRRTNSILTEIAGALKASKGNPGLARAA